MCSAVRLSEHWVRELVFDESYVPMTYFSVMVKYCKTGLEQIRRHSWMKVLADKILIYITLASFIHRIYKYLCLFESNNLRERELEVDPSRNLSWQTKSLPDYIHKSFLNSDIIVGAK